MKPSSSLPPLASLAAATRCVLIVEDELLIRYMLSDFLREAGYQVIEACDADEALILIGTTVPDLIISDVRMPGSIDGLGLLAAVRKAHPILPVIITSGHLQPTLALADGATKFLAKPYMLEDVVQAVQSELAKAP